MRIGAVLPVVALGLLLVGCGRRGAEEPAKTESKAPAEAAEKPALPEPAEVVEDSVASLETFASAEAIDEFLQKRPSRRRRSGYGSGTGSSYGVGGLGLTGTGMGGGGTGEGTIGLGNVGLIGKGAGAGSGAGFGASANKQSAKPASKSGKADSVTNTQEANVDEGGIVKVHGDHLVVLRRGRLFTVEIGDDALKPIDGIDVGSKKAHQAWYDEMLIHGDEVIVVGYSYQYGATELARFSIDDAGKLRHTVTDYLRSNDYYSSRNYASRLVGDTLVFYMPHGLGGGWPTGSEDSQDVPSTCAPVAGKCEQWKGIVQANRVYKPIDDGPAEVLHTVVTCDLSKGAEAMKCEGRGILGPYSRNFYVSEDAVYIWVNNPQWTPAPPWSPAGARPPVNAVVVRLDLSDPSVSAIRTFGAPVDQFSFKQSADGHLNVLVRSQGAGGGMWGAEHNPSMDVALFRAPLTTFSSGKCATVDRGIYVDLPDPEGQGYAFHNRFVGDDLLYGMGAGWGPPAEGAKKPSVFVHHLGDKDAQGLELSHPVDRIEPMGDNAVVVGAKDQDLLFSAIDLSDKPKTAGAFTQKGANQGETRSHGFFFRPESERSGKLGLPIRRGGSSGAAQLGHVSAEVLYLSVDDLKFAELGTLKADPKAGRNDHCKVSCVDWYGNARPLFLGDRVLALLGYEIVEGTVDGGALKERRRVDVLGTLRSR